MASKLRPELILAAVAILLVIMGSSWCGCSGSTAEGFKNAIHAQGAALNYCMQTGVPKTKYQYKPPQGVYGEGTNPFSALSGNTGGPVPPDHLFMFQNDKSDLSCCPSAYSTSTGCVCLSEKQAQYLNERGGNRTLTSYY